MSATIDCGKCGKSVAADSRFCTFCGAQLGAAEGRCPGCGKAAHPGEKFCRHCGAPTLVQRGGSEGDVRENMWARGPSDVARRIEVQDLEGILRKNLLIEAGTKALILQQGEVKGVMGSGRHTLSAATGLLRAINFGNPTLGILMDGGEITVLLSVPKVFTRDQVEVACNLEAAVQITDPEAFFFNLLKSRTHLSTNELGDHIATEARTTVVGQLRTLSTDALAGNLQLRDDLEEALSMELARLLAQSGISLNRLRVVEFESEAFTDLRRDQGDLFIREKRVALNRRIRELLTQDKLDEFKSEEEFGDYLDQIQHEMGVKGLIREEEKKLLTMDFGHGRDRKLILQRLDLSELQDEAARKRAKAALEADEELAGIARSGEISRRLDDARADSEEGRILAEKRRLEHDLDMKEAMDGVDLLRSMKETKRTDERERLEMGRQDEIARLEARSKATTDALLSIVGDSRGGAQIAELEALRLKQGMTPEQMLALVAGQSTESAKALGNALAEKYKAEALASDGSIKTAKAHAEELRGLYEKSQDRTERFTQAVLSQMGQVATTRAQGPAGPQTVIAGGGGYGPPIVVGGPQPPPPPPPPPPSSKGTRRCPSCGDSVADDGAFCPACGERF